MNKLQKHSLAWLFALLISACSTTQKVTLPELEISEPRTVNLTNTPANYMATYTKVTELIHTKLDLSFNWDSAFVIGKATITASPHFYPQNTIVLNAKGFQIKEVALLTPDRKTPANFTYDGYLLTIQLDKEYTRNEEYTVFVDYIAMPNKIKVKGSQAITSDKGLYFINNDGKDPNKPKQIWTQGETEANSCWFPTIDGPQAKMSQEVILTVDAKYVTLSNGTLEYSKNNADGTRTDAWRQEMRHSTYLTMIAVGEFAIVKDKWRNIEVNYYVEPAYEQYAKMIFGNTPEMLEYFSDLLNYPYPWDKYSQIVVRDFVSGAMENTGAVVFFDRMNMTEREFEDETFEDIIAHEAFHHWFGNIVTCESWPNLPLNESFATYSEYIWYEYKYGRQNADIKGYEDMLAYMRSEREAVKNIIRFDVADREDMFDLVSYQKGGRVLHMLRKYVGDEAFYESLNNYLIRNEYKTAEIHDVRIAFEEITGEDLNWFFNQWFLSAGHPELNILKNYNEETGEVIITIHQIQDLQRNPLYRLPIDIDFYVDGKVERKRVWVDKTTNSFAFKYSKNPDLVNIDAEKQLLGVKREIKTKKEWIFQFNNAPLFLDKLEAMNNLLEFAKEPQVFEVFKSAFKVDNWVIRYLATNVAGSLSTEQKEELYPVLVELAKSDTRSYVRAQALLTIAEHYKNKDNQAIFLQTMNDKSPTVATVSLEILGRKK